MDVLVITAKEVAELLRCSVQTVLRMKRAGRMPPPMNLGRPVRWQRSQIVNWINNGCPVPRATPPRRGWLPELTPDNPEQLAESTSSPPPAKPKRANRKTSSRRTGKKTAKKSKA